MDEIRLRRPTDAELVALRLRFFITGFEPVRAEVRRFSIIIWELATAC